MNEEMLNTIYLSVVVPIRNEESYIATTLAALASQDYPKERYELIVVDGRSTDSTRAVVERFICEHPEVNIQLLDNPGKWLSRARNIGVRAAKGQLIAVIDGHVYIPTKQMFANMQRLKEKHHALCLARPAPLLVPWLQKGMPLWIALARKVLAGAQPGIRTYTAITKALSIRLAVVLRTIAESSRLSAVLMKPSTRRKMSNFTTG